MLTRLRVFYDTRIRSMPTTLIISLRPLRKFSVVLGNAHFYVTGPQLRRKIWWTRGTRAVRAKWNSIVAKQAPRPTSRRMATRRRRRRGTNPPISDEQGPLTTADGTAIHIPPEDEMVPDSPQGACHLSRLFAFVDSSSEPDQGGGGGMGEPDDASCPNAEAVGRRSKCPVLLMGSREFAGRANCGGNAFRSCHQLIAWDRVGGFSCDSRPFGWLAGV